MFLNWDISVLAHREKKKKIQKFKNQILFSKINGLGMWISPNFSRFCTKSIPTTIVFSSPVFVFQTLQTKTCNSGSCPGIHHTFSLTQRSNMNFEFWQKMISCAHLGGVGLLVRLLGHLWQRKEREGLWFFSSLLQIFVQISHFKDSVSILF